MTLAHDPRFCSCCVAPVSPAPVIPWNRPGLSEISYRLGTFSTFRQALLDAIADEPALAALSTRESDDFAITVLELFAAVGDVLTFYNERIANELYLRTSRERDSVLRLVRLIGYQMNPGLAATAMLAFTLDQYKQVQIRKGLKVMSVPGQDEKPQIFETLEEITAHAGINCNPVFGVPFAFNAFRRGNARGPVVSRPEMLGAADRLVIFGLSAVEEKTVTALTVSNSGEALAFSPAIQKDGLWGEVARAAKLEQRLRFFGHNAPGKHNVFLPGTTSHPWPKWEQRDVSTGFAGNLTAYPLDARYEGIKPGAQVLVDCGESAAPRLRTAVVVDAEDKPAKVVTTNGDTVLEDTVTHVSLRQTIRGKPGVIPHAGGGHVVLARSGTGAALQLESGDTRWEYLDAPHLASSLEGVRRATDGRWDIFARNHEGNLLQRSRSGGNWSSWVAHKQAQTPSGIFTNDVLSSEPRSLVLNDGHFHVFARGRDADLVTADVTSTSPKVLNTLGGDLTSAPYPVSVDGVSMDVFARGSDRALWWIHFDGTNWGEWESLGGVLATAPVAISTTPGSIEVVSVDDAGSLLYIRNVSGAWRDWIGLGGRLQGEPAFIEGGTNQALVYARGLDDQLWTLRRMGENWSSWESLEGTLTSPPAAFRQSGVIHVYARGGDGTLVHRRRTGSGWEPWESLGDGLGAISDRRKTRIFQIRPEPIEFRGHDYPAMIEGGQVVLRLREEQIKNPDEGWSRLQKGRRIVLQSGTNKHLATISSVQSLSPKPGEMEDHLLIAFTPPLPSAFSETEMFGNIAEASHGETQREVALGNGDASKAFQKFKLPHAPLTYLAGTQSMTGEAELEIRINGELWKAVSSLYNRGPKERIYTVRQNGEGESVLTFGDGNMGSRLPTGPMNVMAKFRKGLGLEGRVKADQLSIPLERPVGLRAVTNPFDADGGADPESRDDARNAAPATVRTFGRAVSLRDFEWIATTSGLVSKAVVTWVWHNLERAVHMTVAGNEGSPLSPTSLDKLYSALNASRDPNRQLFLSNFNRVPVVIQAKVLRNPDYEADLVWNNARQAVLDLFAFDAMPLGRAVHASQVYSAIQSAQGVNAVDVDVFHLKGYEDLTAVELKLRAVTGDPLQGHIRIFPARPTPSDPAQIDRFAKQGFDGATPPVVLPAEQAYLENPDEDLLITVVEAF